MTQSQADCPMDIWLMVNMHAIVLILNGFVGDPVGKSLFRHGSILY